MADNVDVSGDLDALDLESLDLGGESPDQEEPEPAGDTRSEQFTKLTAERAAASAVTTRGRPTTFSEQQLTEIVDLLRAGTAITKVSRAYHTSNDRLRRIYRERTGGDIPPKSAALAPRTRSTPHFIVAEPPEPVAADLETIVRRRRAGKPAVKKARPQPKRGTRVKECAESDSEEDEPRDNDDAVAERLLEGLAAYRAGVDDATVVENINTDLENLRKRGGISALEYLRIKSELKQYRHNNADGAAAVSAGNAGGRISKQLERGSVSTRAAVQAERIGTSAAQSPKVSDLGAMLRRLAGE